MDRSERPASGRERVGPRLLVANQTLTDPAIAAALRARPTPGRWRVVVPATPPDRAERAFLASEHVRIDLDAPGVALARVRLRWMLDQLAADGMVADGEVGDPDPLRAASSALRHTPRLAFVEIVLALLPGRRSVWRRDRVAEQLAARHPLPVATVTAHGGHRAPVGLSRAATSR